MKVLQCDMTRNNAEAFWKPSIPHTVPSPTLCNSFLMDSVLRKQSILGLASFLGHLVSPAPVLH
jgi:hypothetical protein